MGWRAGGIWVFRSRKAYLCLPADRFSKAGTELDVEFLGEQVGACGGTVTLMDPKANESEHKGSKGSYTIMPCSMNGDHREVTIIREM